jgi:hypothetical protein
MFQLSRPYRVVSQTKNDVQVCSLVYDNIMTFNLDHLKLFVGSEQEAKQMALLDKNQYLLIKEILAYRGDPLKQTTCHFDDGDLIWVPYSTDIACTQQFEVFCNARPELYLLLFITTFTKIVAICYIFQEVWPRLLTWGYSVLMW